METAQDLVAKAAALAAAVEALPTPQPPAAPLATQEDLDAIGSSLDAATAAAATKTQTPTS